MLLTLTTLARNTSWKMSISAQITSRKKPQNFAQNAKMSAQIILHVQEDYSSSASSVNYLATNYRESSVVVADEASSNREGSLKPWQNVKLNKNVIWMHLRIFEVH